MQIIVKKPTEAERMEMLKLPTWGCDVSEFDWSYPEEETCLIIEGEVIITYNGGEVSIGKGDMATFPQGLSCVWNVTKPLRKHYCFR